MKKILFLVIIVAIIAVIAVFTVGGDSNPDTEPASKDDLIVVEKPLPGSAIKNPLTIEGRARGTWFFEATFPVMLTNWDGLIIAEGFATAQGDWMTEDYVPFTARLEFTKPDYGTNGILILQKDNPSGLPEHDNAIEIPVTFK